MRPLVHWMFAGFVLALVAVQACRSSRASEPVAVPLVDAVNVPAEPVLVPLAEPLPSPPPVDYRSRCEPLNLPPCRSSADCPAAPDGMARVCALAWWDAGSTERVCVSRPPSKRVRQWRADRLRVLVDEICKPSKGCSPSKLHAYLSTIIQRESAWRPYAAHRLAGDERAASVAWRKMADVYADSPAHDEPWRWRGLGYYGQNSPYLLRRWDATAVPEVLCGEVEATLVHLRVARDRLEQLERGVTCGGQEHHGTADDHGPSWYDVSLSNSGSDPCPGSSGHRLDVREGFERRARSRGLNPYGNVTRAMLGAPVPVAEQDDFARRVRDRMDSEHPSP